MIVLLRLFLSFCFDWEDISNTRDSVSSAIQTLRISSKNGTPLRVVFSLLGVWISRWNILSCLVHYIIFLSVFRVNMFIAWSYMYISKRTSKHKFTVKRFTKSRITLLQCCLSKQIFILLYIFLDSQSPGSEGSSCWCCWLTGCHALALCCLQS